MRKVKNYKEKWIQVKDFDGSLIWVKLIVYTLR